ncbi:hypothetical protein ACS0TY_010856 [Phlomoides rotata]
MAETHGKNASKMNFQKSTNKRQNQYLWLTSLRMRYPRGELGEFEFVLQRWTKLINGSFLLNGVTEGTTRFTNDTFEQKRKMIWENKLTRTKIPDVKHAT